MEFEAYLVQVETQDQEPQPVSVHASLVGAVESAKEAGALGTERYADRPTMKEWYFSASLGPTTVVAIHRLRLLP